MGIVLSLLWAFLIGGALCVIAQILIDKTKLTPARILVGFVVAGVILGAVGVYGPFAKFAGAGATTPLSGFGYLISKGVREAVDEKGLLGAFTGALTAAAGGTAAARQTIDCPPRGLSSRLPRVRAPPMKEHCLQIHVVAPAHCPLRALDRLRIPSNHRMCSQAS